MSTKSERLECCLVLVSGLESVELTLHHLHSLFPSAAPSTDHSQPRPDSSAYPLFFFFFFFFLGLSDVNYEVVWAAAAARLTCAHAVWLWEKKKKKKNAAHSVFFCGPLNYRRPCIALELHGFSSQCWRSLWLSPLRSSYMQHEGLGSWEEPAWGHH